MEANPEMRALTEANPELRAALSDPDALRRYARMMRDPQAVRDMMRQQDLAMSNLEAMPGGFNALRRMYEDVQEPMMDAMAGGSGGGGGGGGSPTAGSRSDGTAGAAGYAMPNPWGSPSDGATQPLSSSGAANPWGGGTSAVGAGASPNPFAAMMAGGGGASPNPFSMAGSAPSMPPGMPGLPPGMDLEQTLQMLDNPMMQGMIEQMTANPEMMRAMMDANPMMRQMREQNPAMASMLSSPEAMRAMMDPTNLRAMMQMQGAMQGQGAMRGGGFPGFPTPPSEAAGGGASMGGGMDFSSLISSLQGASVASPGALPPAERYRAQLQSLRDMGFDDEAAGIAALDANQGNLNRAIDHLLTHPAPAPVAAPAPSSDSNPWDSTSASAPSLAENDGAQEAPSDPKSDEAKKDD